MPSSRYFVDFSTDLRPMRDLTSKSETIGLETTKIFFFCFFLISKVLKGGENFIEWLDSRVQHHPKTLQINLVLRDFIVTNWCSVHPLLRHFLRWTSRIYNYNREHGLTLSKQRQYPNPCQQQLKFPRGLPFKYKPAPIQLFR